MTLAEAKKIIKSECYIADLLDLDRTQMVNTALDMAIQALRYRPIILQEHDAEPRRLRAILDTATEEIYVCRLTKQGADILGITIEGSDEE